jgi:tetratricopeptide (TPR) repeat protein
MRKFSGIISNRNFCPAWAAKPKALLCIVFFILLISNISDAFAKTDENSKGIKLDPQALEKAIQKLDDALKKNPMDAKAWYLKGFTLLETGKKEEAIEAYSKAIKINSKFADAWYEKGHVLLDLGKTEEALDAYEKALEIELVL